MPQPPLKLVIVGDSAFAEVAYEYFTVDSPYEVVAFAVESAYLQRTELFGLPVVALESMPTQFPSGEHAFYVATVYTQLNRLRTRLYAQMKSWGYTAASFISSRAISGNPSFLVRGRMASFMGAIFVGICNTTRLSVVPSSLLIVSSS